MFYFFHTGVIKRGVSKKYGIFTRFTGNTDSSRNKTCFTEEFQSDPSQRR